MRRSVLFLLLFALAGGSYGEVGWLKRVLRTVEDGRRQERVAPLERRRAIDRAAQRYADEIASRPRSQRLSQTTPLESYLEREGVNQTRRAVAHLDLGRGYSHWGSTFSQRWANFGSAWGHAMDPEFDAIGMATATASDGWVVLVAILVDDRELQQDLGALERRILDGVNEVRKENGVPTLRHHKKLQRAARRHSEQMAKFDFFSHTGMDGSSPAGRASAVGIEYRAVAENIYLNLGADDPVEPAIRGWWESTGHRKNMLDARFLETAVGIALTEEGKFYITQMFLLGQE